MRLSVSKAILIPVIAMLFFFSVRRAQGQSATFIGTDTNTEGTWYTATEGTSNVYGADGYDVAQSNSSIPSYASFSVNSQINYTWDSSTSDTRGLLTGSGSSRIAAAWYNPGSFYFSLNFTDGNTHEFALYALDWDNIGRNETIQITNTSTGAVLDSRTISNFTDGIYVIWYISGNVTITVSTNVSVNAEISGAFFGNGTTNSSISAGLSPTNATLSANQTQQFTASVSGTTNTNVAWTLNPNVGTISYAGLYTAPTSISSNQTVTLTATSVVDTSKSASATITLTASGGGGGSSATFVKSDTSTQGNWQGAYGADGYDIALETANLPSYDTNFNVQGASTFTWSSSTTDVRALENPSGGRSATTWFTSSYYFDANFADGNSHQLSVYAVDWDSQSRAESIQITDATSGTVLDTESVSNFSNGIYEVWSITGHVHVNVTLTGGPNAVVSGVFFDTPGGGGGGATATYVTTDTSTQGNWQGVYGADGYDIAQETPSLPSYDSGFNVQNEIAYTWAASTSDPRALENPSGGRSATTWYNPSTFYLDVNFTDGNTHQLAIYAVDWDSEGRAESIQIVDANSGSVLNTQNISSFTNGVYVVWKISGHVHVVVTLTGGGDTNAVISGAFFDTSSGGGGGGITVTVNPSSVNLSANGSQQFSATVTGSSNTSVTWSINPSIGSISTSGLYNAPSTISSNETVTVTALSQANNMTTGTATITLQQSGTGPSVHYYFGDALGTARVITDASGNICYESDYYPFGGERPAIADTCSNNYKFTGKERDSESNLDNFGARFFASQFGRFMSPDPGNAGANPSNPQSWNMYSYVFNNPLSLTDLAGLDPGDCQQYAARTRADDGDDPGDGGDGGVCPDPVPPPDLDPCSGEGDSCYQGEINEDIQQDAALLTYLAGLNGSCLDALGVAGQNLSAVQNALNNWPLLSQAGDPNGITPGFLGAVGIRESGFQNVFQNGGHGVGIFQIDLGQNPNVSVTQALNPTFAANKAADMLSHNESVLSAAFPNFNNAQLDQAAAATYNMGLYNKNTGNLNISGNPATIDVGTSPKNHGNYGSNVMAIAGNCLP